MTKVNVSISNDVLKTFPELQVAAVRVRFEDARDLQGTMDRLEGDLEFLRNEVERFDPITSMPEIATWRSAYGRMGVKPSKFHSSIEALMRRVKKGQDIRTGLEVVDFYNLISIREKSPVGAYDAQKLQMQEIKMRKALPHEDRFDPLGSNTEAFPLSKDLVVYASGNNVLCWGFNTRDSTLSSVDQTSKEVLFFSETTEAKYKEMPHKTMQSLCEALGGAVARDAAILELNNNNPVGLL